MSLYLGALTDSIRIDSGIAHEYAEDKGGGSDDYAYEHVPEPA